MDIDADMLNQILKSQAEADSDVISIVNSLMKSFIDESGRQPTIEEKRQIHASAYSSRHNS